MGMSLLEIIKRSLQLTSFLFITFFILAQTTAAQTGELTINITPRHPEPFQTVNISVEDFSRNINNENISWSLNGTVQKTGVGEKRFSFETGALGTVSRITVNVGGSSQEITIRPTQIDLIWQADTQTPPFYRGKAMHTNQSALTIVAEPHFFSSQGTRINPDSLIYKWKRDGRVSDSASGYGLKTFSVAPPVLAKPETIEVEVSSSDNTFFSTASITIPITESEVLVYENHPLYGIMFNRLLNGQEFQMNNPETSFVAFPINFSTVQNLANDLKYNWRLNSFLIDQNDREVIFRRPESGSGRSAISLNVSNPDKFMQTATAQMTAAFSQQ